MKASVADGVARIDWVPSQQEWAATGYDGQSIGLFPTQMAAAKAIGGGFPDVLRAALMAEDEAANTKTVRVGVPARFRQGPMGGSMAEAGVLKAVPALPAPEPEAAKGGARPRLSPKRLRGGGTAVPEPVVEPTPIVWRQEPGPVLAVMRDGSVVPVPEPAAEAVEKIDTPAAKRCTIREGKASVAWSRADWGWVATGADGERIGLFRTKLQAAEAAGLTGAPAVFISAASCEAEKVNTGPATPGRAEYWHGRDGWRWYLILEDHQGGPFPTFDEAVAERWRWLR